MGKTKYIDAEAFKRRILSYGIVHEGDRIQIPFYKHYFAKAYVAILRWVCEEVDDTPAADIPRWIPVAERLPEEVGLYPVTCLDGGRQIDLGQWCIDECGEGFWECDWCDSHSVIAWMPLPEPYKEGEQNV